MSDTESVTVTASWNDTDNQSTKWTFSEENSKVNLPNHTTITDDNHPTPGDSTNYEIENGRIITGGENGRIITGGENDNIITGGENGKIINGGENGNIIAGGENGNIIAGSNNISFVNINYTIQPKRFLSHFKMIPTKKILDNIRSVCQSIYCCIYVSIHGYAHNYCVCESQGIESSDHNCVSRHTHTHTT